MSCNILSKEFYAVHSFVIMQSFSRVVASHQGGSSKQRTLILYDSLHSDSSDFLAEFCI